MTIPAECDSPEAHEKKHGGGLLPYTLGEARLVPISDPQRRAETIDATAIGPVAVELSVTVIPPQRLPLWATYLFDDEYGGPDFNRPGFFDENDQWQPEPSRYEVPLPWIAVVTQGLSATRGWLLGASNTPITSFDDVIGFLPLPHLYANGRLCPIENRFTEPLLPTSTPLERGLTVFNNFATTVFRYFDFESDDQLIPTEWGDDESFHRNDAELFLEQWAQRSLAEVLTVRWRRPQSVRDKLHAAVVVRGYKLQLSSTNV